MELETESSNSSVTTDHRIVFILVVTMSSFLYIAL